MTGYTELDLIASAPQRPNPAAFTDTASLYWLNSREHGLAPCAVLGTLTAQTHEPSRNSRFSTGTPRSPSVLQDLQFEGIVAGRFPAVDSVGWTVPHHEYQSVPI